MNSLDQAPLIDYFSEIPDPRMDRCKLHDLQEILILSICAVICGAEEWTTIETFAHSKESWFRRFLKLENGIPSHDTFGRVFACLDPIAFENCFLKWISAICQLEDDLIPIDGKTLRHSYDRASSKAAIHMVSAWSSKNNLVLGQIKVDDKSNEITAIPKLLEILDLSGCLVTTDAMGCQKTIAEKIVEKGADYTLALKGNQGQFFEDVQLFLDDAHLHGFKNIDHQFYETIEKDHGRIETRKYWVSSEIRELPGIHAWEGLQSIGLVESQRIIGEKESSEFRYYINSYPADVKRFSYAVRNHWGIENRLHWSLDVSFNEDDSRIRQGNAPQNFSLLRKIALNLLRKETSLKRGIKTKRLKAGWDNDYLIKVLFQKL